MVFVYMYVLSSEDRAIKNLKKAPLKNCSPGKKLNLKLCDGILAIFSSSGDFLLDRELNTYVYLSSNTLLFYDSN